MVKALVFGTKDCAFESHRGRILLFWFLVVISLGFSYLSAYMLIITIDKDIRYSIYHHAPLRYPGKCRLPNQETASCQLHSTT